MAFNGIVKKQICNGLIEISVEWSVEQDLANGINNFTFKFYEDTTKCFIVDSADQNTNENDAANGYTARSEFFIYYNGQKISSDAINGIYANRHKYLDGKGNGRKDLLGTEVIPVEAGEEAGKLEIRFDYRPYNNRIKAYSDYITYVICDTASYPVDVDGIFEVDGMERVTVGNIYGNYILGNEHDIAVTKKREDFSHRVEWVCGTASGLICENSTDATFKFTPDEALAAQSLKSEYVDVTFNITTYCGDITVGTRSEVFTFTIPAHVIPSCSIEVTDSVKRNGQTLFDIYGGFVQKYSRFNIVTTPTLAYNSPIEEYAIDANGREWDSPEIVTTVINNSGLQDITATVKDGRGRTSEPAIKTFDVIPYSSPKVIRVIASRCNEDGEYDGNGDHIKVTFSAKVSPVNNRNSATYICSHSKSTGIELKNETMTDYSGDYEVKDGTFKFKADPNSSYTIAVTAVDDFEESEPVGSGGTMKTILMNWLASGCGLRFGGIATIENCVENSFLTYPSGGFMFPTLEKGKNYYEITTPNVYIGENADDFDHMPEDLTGAFVMLVLPLGNEDDWVYFIVSKEREIYTSTYVDHSLSTWENLMYKDAFELAEKRIGWLENDVEKLKDDIAELKA